MSVYRVAWKLLSGCSEVQKTRDLDLDFTGNLPFLLRVSLQADI